MERPVNKMDGSALHAVLVRLKVEGLNSVGIGSLLTSHWTARQGLLRVEWRPGVPAAPLWCCCDLRADHGRSSPKLMSRASLR